LALSRHPCINSCYKEKDNEMGRKIWEDTEDIDFTKKKDTETFFCTPYPQMPFAGHPMAVGAYLCIHLG
jgi:hypothetical protein